MRKRNIQKIVRFNRKEAQDLAAPMLKNEAVKWNKFQSEIERTYLRPNQSEMKWQ